MKNGYGVLALLFGGIFILLACVTIPRSLSGKVAALHGFNGLNKAEVTVKRHLEPRSKSPLAPGDVRKLAESLGTNEYSYIARPAASTAQAFTGGESGVVSKVAGTNFMLPMFLRMDLIYGSFFTETAEKEGAYVAVVDDRLAWNAFRTGNAVGNYLELFGRKFRIVGVVKRDASILSMLTDDGFPEVFIPGSILFELNSTAAITSFQVRTEDNSTLDRNRLLISEALQEAGKNPSEYDIADYNIAWAQLDQKPDIIVFLLGCIILLILLIWLKDTVKEAACILRREWGTDYLINVIRKNAGMTGVSAAKALCAVSAMIITGSVIRFDLFIPPGYIPEELIDTSFYSVLIKSNIRAGIENQGFIAETGRLLLNKAEMLTGWPLLIMSAAGFPLIYCGFAGLRRLDMEPHRLSLACGLFMLFSLIVLTLAGNAAGLPPVLKNGNLLVVWAFIYINILYFNYMKKKGMNENEQKTDLHNNGRNIGDRRLRMSKGRI